MGLCGSLQHQTSGDPHCHHRDSQTHDFGHHHTHTYRLVCSVVECSAKRSSSLCNRWIGCEALCQPAYLSTAPLETHKPARKPVTSPLQQKPSESQHSFALLPTTLLVLIYDLAGSLA